MASNQGNPAVFDDKEVYGLQYVQKKHIGRAVIINNVTFNKRDDRKDVKERTGSRRDSKELKKVLDDMGFKGVKKGEENGVSDFDDVTKSKLKDIMAEAAQLMNQDGKDDFGCFLCILLSYGEPGVIYCKSDDESKPNEPCELKDLQELFKPHKCGNMALKPKIFLVQACPYLDVTAADGDDKVSAQKLTVVKIPRESDFVTHFSRQPGGNGWRDKYKKNLSEYVYALTETLNDFRLQKHSDDFLRMLTRINRLMIEGQKDCPGDVPLVTSTLTKRINWDFYRPAMKTGD